VQIEEQGASVRFLSAAQTAHGRNAKRAACRNIPVFEQRDVGRKNKIFATVTFHVERYHS
jgi:hypothetical protein